MHVRWFVAEIAYLARLLCSVVDAAGGWARAENAAGARKLAVMAEIFSRRTGLAAGQRELWWIDPDAAGPPVVCCFQRPHRDGVASDSPRDRAARPAARRWRRCSRPGWCLDLLVRTIVSRTYLIDDDEAMAAVDVALAKRVTRWGALSVKKTEDAFSALA